MAQVAKVALVTGGASGIGLSFVTTLLKNGIQNVAVVDINKDHGNELAKNLNKQFGNDKVAFVQADVTNERQFEDAFEKTIHQFKKLDIVINNAGIFNEQKWQQCIEINCKGVVKGCYLAMQYMGKNNGGQGGVVVNTSSIMGLETMASLPVYIGTKHFVVGFTRSLGKPYQFNLNGIKFFSICPGVTDTALTDNYDNSLPNWPGIAKEFSNTLLTYPRQSMDHVGESLLTVLNKGENGSHWVIEGGEPPYPVQFPDRQSFKP